MLQHCTSSFTSLSPLCMPQLSLSYLPIFYPALPVPSLSSSASFTCFFRSEPHHSVCMGWQACFINRARLGGLLPMAQAFPGLSSASLGGVPQLLALWLFPVLSNLWLSTSRSAICQEERNELQGGLRGEGGRGLGKSIKELKITMGQLWMSLRHFSSPSPQLMPQSKRGQAAMRNSLSSAAAPLPSLRASLLPALGLPHCYRKGKQNKWKGICPKTTPLPPGTLSATESFVNQRCEAGKDRLVPMDSPTRGVGEGEVSARLSPPAYFSQVYSDRKFSLDPIDRDAAFNSRCFEHWQWALSPLRGSIQVSLGKCI